MSRANQNAKQEFLLSIGSRPVKCAEIVYTACSLWEINEEDGPPPKKLILKVEHTEEEFESFLNELDFNYDAGYGGQELFGTVWFSASDVWMTRWEYDGSECWQINCTPKIPQELF